MTVTVNLFFRILKWTTLAVVCLLIVCFLYFYFIYFGRPKEVSTIDQADSREWRTVSFKGNTSCSDGSEFAIFVKKGKSKNLIIHFSGGGACWDDKSCAHPISLWNAFDGDTREIKAFYFPSLLRIFPKAISGLGDHENPSNAFRDWNLVFIPYCTGDLHIGNTTNTYAFDGRQFEIHHNGRNNSLAALEWVFANFKETDKIMVSGESAGAYGSAFWASYVADHYYGRKIYQLSDGALLASGRWKEILDTVWRSESTGFLHFKIDKDIFEDALAHRNDSVKRLIKHLHSNTIYDHVLTRFSAALNHLPTNTNDFIDDWSVNMLASMNRLRHSGIDYHYFITDWGYDSIKHGTPHTMTSGNYYRCEEDGISFAEWLKRNVIDDEDLSVGEKLLR